MTPSLNASIRFVFIPWQFLTRLQRTLCVAKKFYDLLDGIPVSRRRRDTQKLLDLAEVTDRFHLASIQTEDEFFSDRNNFQEPLIL